MASSLPILMLLLCSLTVAEAELRVYNLRATDLPSDFFGTTDGYVKVVCGSYSVGETAVRKNTVNPQWTEVFVCDNVGYNDVLRLEVHDSDIFSDDLVGECETNIRHGTYFNTCNLKGGGTLNYDYTLF
ncbi:uncharacterized protein LOC131463702 [Solea solea]|uniref:uncharacterized protein LOC131463702 n=1 Tax=Solea solea TaxID=90069 RepID=UPI00272AE7F9|nr:uncharacterized protein LOC131463702 [Solea solea]